MVICIQQSIPSAVAELVSLIPTLCELGLLAEGFVLSRHFKHVAVILQKEGITPFDTRANSEEYPGMSAMASLRLLL
jgi:hypothetical protein